MLQIAELADLGAGTVYNYFTSKGDIVVAVMNKIFVELAERIHQIACKLGDPVSACVYTVREIMFLAATSPISSRLMSHAVLGAETIFRLNSPYMLPEMEAARQTDTMHFDNAELTWRLMTYAMVGFAIEVRKDRISIDDLNESVTSVLGIAGMRRDIARKYADRNWPELPEE